MANSGFRVDLDAQNAGGELRIVSSIHKEGAVLALDSMVLHNSGPRPGLAHRFINFMLDGRNRRGWKCCAIWIVISAACEKTE